MRSAVKAAIIVGTFALISPFIWQALSLPDPVWNVSSGTDNICQKNLDFSNGISEFSFSYSNLGEDKGNFEATVSSDNILLKYKGSNQEFAFKNSKAWVVDVDKSTGFQFSLKLPENIEEPETIAIQTGLVCSKNVFGNFAIPCGWESYTCNYQNQHVEDFGPDYELIK